MRQINYMATGATVNKLHERKTECTKDVETEQFALYLETMNMNSEQFWITRLYFDVFHAAQLGFGECMILE